MAWNSSKLVNTARGCLPWKVWICSCWRQGWKAGDCFSVLKSCVLPWASASPDAGGGTLSWVYSMENRTVWKRKGGHPYLCLWRGCWEGNLYPFAQVHHAGKPWGHSLWQQPQLCDPLLWGIRAFLLLFNHLEMTWSVWSVSSRQRWARCTRRRPRPSNVFTLLPGTETGCLLLKVPCVIRVTWSLPKSTCGFHARLITERG